MALPNTPAPALSFPLLGGGTWTLADQSPRNFTIIVFYRGKHCPICKTYLKEIDRLVGKAEKAGFDVVAVSMDDQGRAQDTLDEIATKELRIGYDLDEDAVARWGLYLSEGRDGTAEPGRFSEPGLFVIRPDGRIFFAQKQSAPFTRPDFDKLLDGLQFALDKDYPARGTLTAAA